MDYPAEARERLQKALEDAHRDVYDSFEFIAEGGTALVWKMKRVGIPHYRVLKVLKPTLSQIDVAEDGGGTAKRTFESLFKAESARILELQHSNIIKLYDANVLSVGGDSHPWYAMEYVDGAKDLDKYFMARREAGELAEDDVMRVILQAAEGIAACHRADVIHADIKPGNIMVGKDGSVRIVDFGFAKSLKQLQEERAVPNSVWISDRRYMHPELLELLDQQQKAAPESASKDENAMWLSIPRETLTNRGRFYDLYAFGKTLEVCWATAGLSLVVTKNADFYQRLYQRLKVAGSDEALKYDKAEQIIVDLEKVSRGYSPESVVAELNAFPVDSIRIPSRGRVALTDRLMWLIDRPWFQRLRGIRQLGPAHLVYPGATHSRFEHSLGVLERTTSYVRSLWGASRQQYFKQSAGEKDISALLVAALLHDVGHYPFAHAFEEVEPNRQNLVNHSKISTDLILGRFGDVIAPREWEEFADHLKRDWGIEPADVAAVLDSSVKAPNVQRHLLPCLHSVIDGPLDADKLDYLVRDGHHAGSPYGSAIDEEKFLQSIVAPGAEQAIGIWEKGLVAAEAIYLARYHMFVTVYWHHLTRACERMISEAVRSLRLSNPASFKAFFASDAFRMSDDELLTSLVAQLGNARLSSDLIEPLLPSAGRRTGHYRRLLTLTYGPHDPRDRPHETTVYEYIREMFDQYMQGGEQPGRKYRLFEAKLRGEVLRLLGPGACAHHVLLDVPDPRVESPKSFFVYSEGRIAKGVERQTALLGRQPISDRSTLHSTFLQDWKRHARKIRIYVCPRIDSVDTRERLAPHAAEIANIVESLARDLHGREDVSEVEVAAAWDALTSAPFR